MIIKSKGGSQSVSDLMSGLTDRLQGVQLGSRTLFTADKVPGAGVEKKSVPLERKVEEAPVVSERKERKKVVVDIMKTGKRKPYTVRLDEGLIEMLKKNSFDAASDVSAALEDYALKMGWK